MPLVTLYTYTFSLFSNVASFEGLVPFFVLPLLKVTAQKILFDVLPYDSYMERAEMTVTGAEVGSMSVKLTGLLSGELLWRNTEFSAKKTDGTDVGVIFSGGTSVGTSGYPGGPIINADSNIILLFDDVVDPADIASVTIGGTEIVFR